MPPVRNKHGALARQVLLAWFTKMTFEPLVGGSRILRSRAKANTRPALTYAWRVARMPWYTPNRSEGRRQGAVGVGGPTSGPGHDVPKHKAVGRDLAHSMPSTSALQGCPALKCKRAPCRDALREGLGMAPAGQSYACRWGGLRPLGSAQQDPPRVRADRAAAAPASRQYPRRGRSSCALRRLMSTLAKGHALQARSNRADGPACGRRSRPQLLFGTPSRLQDLHTRGPKLLREPA